MVSAEIRKRLLVLEASRWIGVSEVGGQNKGQLVEMFQKSADDKASKEPWCLAFVLFCVKIWEPGTDSFSSFHEFKITTGCQF